jgi:hypothetical protein
VKWHNKYRMNIKQDGLHKEVLLLASGDCHLDISQQQLLSLCWQSTANSGSFLNSVSRVCGMSCSTPRGCRGSTPLLFLARVLGTPWYWVCGVFYW